MKPFAALAHVDPSVEVGPNSTSVQRTSGWSSRLVPFGVLCAGLH